MFSTLLLVFSIIAQYSVLLLSEKVAIPIQCQLPSIVLQYNMAGIVHPCYKDTSIVPRIEQTMINMWPMAGSNDPVTIARILSGLVREDTSKY